MNLRYLAKIKTKVYGRYESTYFHEVDLDKAKEHVDKHGGFILDIFSQSGNRIVYITKDCVQQL